jgi:hypothetical protein
LEVLSERLSILKKDDVLSIVILPDRNRTRLGLMFLWLFAWSVCGAIVAANYFTVTDRNMKLFIIVYLAFWLYFEVLILRAFIWRKSGREKIWVAKGLLHYQRETFGRGKVSTWLAELVSPFRLVDVRATNFLDNLNQSFWVRGGERIEFTTQGKTIRLGMQLSDAEAKSVLKELAAAIGQAIA